MDYSKHYTKLIERARIRNLEFYTERHHIIPRCLNGTDDISNIVELTPEEHYVAHQLLVKIYPDIPSLAFAAHMMGATRKGNKLYGWLRRAYSEAKSISLKGKPPNNKGKKLSEERKRQISETSSKYRHSEESRRKISESHMGNQYGIGNKSRTGQKQSEEERRKKSIAGTGKRHSEESKKKMSEQKKGIPKPKKECPYCHRLMGPTNMVRYHGDKCKSK